MKPQDIESLSFHIIDQEAGDHGFDRRHWQIVRRMIHTSADFEYIDSIRFPGDAVEAGIRAIRSGAAILTDTNMARVGIRKDLAATFGCRVSCLMTDPEVARLAAADGGTRAEAAVDAAIPLMEGGIYVIGNAPTALLRLIRRMAQQKARPALVVGLPVGFVNAAESKEELVQAGITAITNVGRKGGSNVAASVVNALLLLATEKG